MSAQHPTVWIPGALFPLDATYTKYETLIFVGFLGGAYDVWWVQGTDRKPMILITSEGEPVGDMYVNVDHALFKDARLAEYYDLLCMMLRLRGLMQ